jgi:hypothetical protein
MGDLTNVRLGKGKNSWTNKRTRPKNIATRLDRFLIQSSLLEASHLISSNIIPWSYSDHKPISLEIQFVPNYGHIPFQFNPYGFFILSF